jgi:hypothetical protein
MLKTKGLWVEDLDGNQARVIQHIKGSGANLVCIRTTSSQLQGLIPTFHGMGLKVYGWRWTHVTPRLKQDGTPDLTDPSYVPNETKHVVNDLIPNGLDGYIFDVESDEEDGPHDWDNKNVNNLTQLASDHATGIRDAFVKRGIPFKLGMTSHARAFYNYPNIPWQPFLNVVDTLYPQTYWRYYNDEKKSCVDEAKDETGKGTPDQAMTSGFTDYGPKGKPLVPIAGEIRCANAGEMTHFGALVAQRTLAEAHFYVDVDNNILSAPGVFAEIKAL